jgi:branched-chain amino acid transport system ATP-binding protein
VALLEVRGLRVEHNGVAAVRDVSLRVDRGEVVAVLGANGAGKTTLLRAIAGVKTAAAGAVDFDGQPARGARAHELVARGISFVPQDRGLFPHLSVADNLRMGGFLCASTRERAKALDAVLGRFPILGERKDQLARTLSGGEQQMLAIGRVLMRKPALIMLDEPSLALAPAVVKEIGALVRELSGADTGVLLVEQNVHLALGIAHRAYVLSEGAVVLEGTAADLLANDEIRAAYFGERRDSVGPRPAQSTASGAGVSGPTVTGSVVRTAIPAHSCEQPSRQSLPGRFTGS